MGRLQYLLGAFGLIGFIVLAATGPSGTVVGGTLPQVDSNASVAQSSGAQFAGGIATEGATLETEYQRRTLNVSLERAETPVVQVGVINRGEIALDKQLDSLEARSARLATGQRTGQLEQDRYRAESAVLKTEVTGITRRIAILRSAVMELPTAQRDAHRSLHTELDELAKRAHAIDEDNDNEDVGDDDSADDDDSTDDDDSADDDDNSTEAVDDPDD